MRFISYSDEGSYYEFLCEDGGKYIIPSTSVILIDDESNLISVKLVASRKVIGIVPKN